MDFVDIPFPERIAFQAEAESDWRTDLTAVLSGFESTNQRWSQARHVYDAGLAIRVASDYLLVKHHFHQMRGRAKAFPFRDPIDHEVVQATGVLTQITAGPTWQLYYRYGSGAHLWDRIITRPLVNGITLYRTRAMVVTTLPPGSGFGIESDTGIVTIIPGHLAGDTYAWSGEFNVPCRYNIDRLPGLITNKQPGSDGELFVECGSIPIVEVREAA